MFFYPAPIILLNEDAPLKANEEPKMIINYTFGNFRTFKEDATLSMKASSQTTFNDRLIRTKEGRILPVAVIYGANASGKSNLILSLMVFRDIVLNGSITTQSPQTTIANLELLPSLCTEEDGPMQFSIEFITKEDHFRYSIGVKVGRLERIQRKVVYEKLEYFKKKQSITLFERNDSSIRIARDKDSIKVLSVTKSFLDNVEEVLCKNTDKTDIFLARGFKSTICGPIADSVMEFFRNGITAITDFPLNNPRLEHVPIEAQNCLLWNETLDKFVKKADFGSHEICFKCEEKDDKGTKNNADLFSIYDRNGSKVLVNADLMESRGTIKLIDFAILFSEHFSNGNALVIDEFDSSLHPEIVKGIISVFSDPSINKAGAQLIFTTHNPIYLSNKLFRRDQIFFVEKDSSSYQSDLYTLADFGSTEVRNDENYMINYFKGKYATLPYIDFSEIVNNGKEETI